MDTVDDPDPVGLHDHLVAFYEHEDFLTALVVDFLEPVLSGDTTGLVLATRAHTRTFRAGLADHQQPGLTAALETGRLVVRDARVAQDQLRKTGPCTIDTFNTVLGDDIEQLAGTGRPLRIYGEVVALMWQEGDLAGALALEDAWDRFATMHAFDLLCAYPMRDFASPESVQAFLHVCQRHTAVTNEAYAGLDAGRTAPTMRRP